MPWGMHIIDEKTLEDEIRRNPKSTRWVSKRGVMRKKQGSGKEKHNAVDGGHALERTARDASEREMQQREMQQRGMRASDMQAPETQAQETQAQETQAQETQAGETYSRQTPARQMHAQQIHEREAPDREMHERNMGGSRGFNRRRDEQISRNSDPYHRGHDHEDGHNLDSQSYHRARPSRRPNSLNYPEVHFAPLRRSHPPSFSDSQPVNQIKGPDNTRRPASDFQSAKLPPSQNQSPDNARRPAPRFQSAKLPPKPQQKRESPTYKASQRPRAEPHPRSELPRQGRPSRRKGWTPPAANDVVADVDPMTGAGRTWDSRETRHATGNPDFW
ncbi:MAG: hypothetical protein ASARMPRED_000612 [Alectoria sarmentosa]|nr:MAG: hypothetical protein ASARMPRED_000612 [Alectoria sarmentosa]